MDEAEYKAEKAKRDQAVATKMVASLIAIKRFLATTEGTTQEAAAAMTAARAMMRTDGTDD